MASDLHPEGDEDPKETMDLQAKVLALESELDQAKKDLTSRVKHYESKLVTMSVINNALQNENEKLKEESAKASPSSTDEDLAELQEEFTRRLGAADRTASNMKDECFTLRQNVEGLKNEKDELTKELQLKQNSIDQYVTEGGKLSTKVGELEGSIKRCRVDLAKAEQEKESLLSLIKVLEDAAKESELSRTVNAASSGQALQQAQQELEEVKKQAAKDLRIANEEGEIEVARLSQQIAERERFWANNLDALRTSLTRSSQTASEREDSLRGEMRRLEERCRIAEAAHEEATANISEATTPLLRQLTQKEALMQEKEEQHNFKRQELEAATKKCLESQEVAEARAAAAEKKEEAAESIVSELHAEIKSSLEKLQKSEKEVQDLESKLVEAEMAVTNSQIAQEALQEKLLEAEENLALADKAQDEAAEHFLAEQAAREEAERFLEESRSELKAEADGFRHQFDSLKSSLAEQEREFRTRMTSLRTASLSENGLEDLTRTSETKSLSDESPETSFIVSSPLKSVSPKSSPDLSEQERSKGGLSANPVNMERLSSEVRRLQGEVTQLHKDLNAAQSARDHASEDLLKATERLNSLEKDAASAPKVRKELEDLKKRHEMALVIIGEMNEKSDELEADMSDVKALYREQMNLLISQVDPQNWPDGYRICLFCSHCAQEQRRTKRGGAK